MEHDTTEYYSTIKTNEILPFVTTWMDLESIMLNKISQTKQDKYHMISLIYGTLKTNKQNKKTTENKLIDTENILMVARWEGVLGMGKKGKGVKSTYCQL